MAEKKSGKSINVAYIVIAIVVVIVVIFGIVKLAKNSETGNIVSGKESSSNSEVEKIQKRIEALNKEIDDLQNNQINPELEKLNGMYEEYVKVMNEYQTGEHVEEPAQENSVEEVTE